MWIDLIVKLLLAFILGGIIGLEREQLGRPAGLRTHVLVCVGAALVQITVLDYYAINANHTYDPFRMAAQVISGIGFLGAGTIIKEGVSVKGLTTAASLWAVACVGITVGSGLYIQAIAANFVMYLGIKGLKKVGPKITKMTDVLIIQMVMPNSSEKIGEIGRILKTLEIEILGMDVQQIDEDILVELSLRPAKKVSRTVITEELYKILHIKSIKLL